MKHRNAFCSFCRKSHTDVGPLVEGPGDVYICGECVELCQSIIDQEKRRRNPPAPPAGPPHLREALDRAASGQEEAKQALVWAASLRHEGRGRILLTGPSRAARHFLARTLAHALGVPFAAGDARGPVNTEPGTQDVSPLLISLLQASDFDEEAARQGVVYWDGVDRPDAQEALVQAWQAQVVGLVGRLRFDLRGVLFVCGGTFAALDEGVASSGRPPEGPVTAEALVAAGAQRQWVDHLAAIARAAPLDDETLTRVVAWVDFSRSNVSPAAAAAEPGHSAPEGM